MYGTFNLTAGRAGRFFQTFPPGPSDTIRRGSEYRGRPSFPLYSTVFLTPGRIFSSTIFRGTYRPLITKGIMSGTKFPLPPPCVGAGPVLGWGAKNAEGTGLDSNHRCVSDFVPKNKIPRPTMTRTFLHFILCGCGKNRDNEQSHRNYRQAPAEPDEKLAINII